MNAREREARDQRLIADYNAGASLWDCAFKYGLAGAGSAWAILFRHGVARRPRGSPKGSGGAPGPHHCSLCYAEGHNKRTCTTVLQNT